MIDPNTTRTGDSDPQVSAMGAPPPFTAGAPAGVTTASSNVAAQALVSWWKLLRALAAGNPEQVTVAALGSGPGASTHRTWIVAALVNGTIVGVSIMLLMARLAGEFQYFFAPAASEYFAAFLIPIVCSIALLLARAGAIAGLFALRQRTITFKDAAALASTTFVASAPLLAMALLLSLIPGTFALVALAVGVTFTTFYAEIALYISVARVGRFSKSPALPHALLSTAWLCLMSFISATIIMDLATDLLDTLQVAL